MSIVKLRFLTPGIAGNIFAVPACSAYHIRTDSDTVADLQIIPVKGEVSGSLFVNSNNFHDKFMPLNNRERNGKFIRRSFVLYSFAAVCMFIRAADTSHQDFTDGGSFT